MLYRFNCGCIGIPMGDYSRGREFVEALVFKYCDAGFDEGPFTLCRRGMRLRAANFEKKNAPVEHRPPKALSPEEESKIFSKISALIADGEELQKLAHTLARLIEAR